jgi:plastocyanin
MKIDQRIAIRCSLLLLALVVLANYATAESKSSKYACSESNPAQLCNTSNTCGSASTPCTVDVKRTANAASSTPSIPNARSNALFCVNPGTTVTWKSTGKDIGFVVDVGPSSPFEPPGAIIGGTDRAVSVVAKKTGCYKYSAGACMSGAIYGMCGTAKAELIITGGSN